MTPTLLALTLVLAPRAAEAARLRTSLPGQLSAPHATMASARDGGLPRVRARRRPASERSPRAWYESATQKRAGPHETIAARRIHVYDGDTFYVGVDTIRLRGIDTPELGEPRAYEAKRRLIELLHAGPVTVVRRTEDVYGRIVADVYVSGRDVASVLRAEGYAKPRAPPLNVGTPNPLLSGTLDIPSPRASCDVARRGARLCPSRR
jgi:endonuclease YncB( thermonuclease family)